MTNILIIDGHQKYAFSEGKLSKTLVKEMKRVLSEKHNIKTTVIEKGYDIIYFDAFAPEKQPEMWEQSLFNSLYQILNEGGILTTYCAKGIVRRMLQSAGFIVERLAGPPGGKREILRATK